MIAVLGTQDGEGLQAEFLQGEEKLSILLCDVGDTEPGGVCPEEGHRKQVVHRPGRLAVAVDELIHQLVGLLLALHCGDAAVQVHPLLRGGDVFVRDGGGHAQIGGALRPGGQGLALLQQDGLLQQLEVHIIANAEQKAGLLRAQHVARPPDLQVPHGDFEAGAELGELPDGLHPL